MNTPLDYEPKEPGPPVATPRQPNEFPIDGRWHNDRWFVALLIERSIGCTDWTV